MLSNQVIFPLRNQGFGPSNSVNPIVFYDNRRTAYHLPQVHPSTQGIGPPPGPGQMSSPLTQCFWTFFWLAVMLFIAFPIGLFSCQLYVLLSPLSAICSCFSKVTDLLLRLAHLPLGCAHNMVQAKPLLSL